MKLIRPFILVLSVAQLSLGADSSLQRHKESKNKRFDQKNEVAAFYLYLLTHNPTVQRQLDSLTRKAPSYGDVHFGTDDPQVVEWFPRTGSWSAGENFSEDARFLVIQPLSFTRPRQHDYELAVVSEFHVVHTGKVHFEPPDQEVNEKLDSNEITITFLGFRNFKLTPVKQ